MNDVGTLLEHIARLREENDQLRQAAHCFGDLAERLMHQLEIERRRIAELEARQTSQRRLPELPGRPASVRASRRVTLVTSRGD